MDAWAPRSGSSPWVGESWMRGSVRELAGVFLSLWVDWAHTSLVCFNPPSVGELAATYRFTHSDSIGELAYLFFLNMLRLEFLFPQWVLLYR